MKFTEVSFTETFPIYSDGREVRWQKIYCKAKLDAEDDRRQALYDCKKTVQSFFFESNKADEKKAEVKKEPSVIGTIAPSMEEQINSCTEIKTLESYKFIVKNKPEWEKIYNNRLKELT